MIAPRILIVEDEHVVSLFIQSSLEKLGYGTCPVVVSGAEALAAVAQTPPDLVLMDIRISGDMDGIETAERICKEFDIPVVYLTALTDESTLQRAKLTQPYGYLVKPFSEKELRPAIEIALYRHSLERKLRQSERWLTSTLGSLEDAVIVTDLRGAIIHMNPAAETETRWRQPEAAGQPLSDILLLRNADGESAADWPVAKAIQGGAVITLASQSLQDRLGGRHKIDASIAPVRDEQGSVVGAVVVCHRAGSRSGSDFNSTVQVAAQTAHLASLGVMATGLALELAPSLHAIRVNADSVLFWHKRNQGILPDAFIKKLHDITDNVNRIEGILRHVPAFGSVPDSRSPSAADLNAAVTNSLDLIERRIHTHGIKPELNLGAGIPRIRGDRQRLEYILINLVTHALALLDRSSLSDKRIRAATRVQSQWAVLDVMCGAFSPEDGALDPVEGVSGATPSGDESADLQLSLARLLVEELEGQLAVRRSSAGGLKFTILLPLIELQAE